MEYDESRTPFTKLVCVDDHTKVGTMVSAAAVSQTFL